MRKKIEISGLGIDPNEILLPCPFCGSLPYIDTFVADYDGKKYNQYSIKCINETWDQDHAVCLKPSYSEIGPCLDGFSHRILARETDQDAINELVRLWNTRKGAQ